MLKVGSKDANGSANTDSKVLIKSTVLDTKCCSEYVQSWN